MSVKAVLFDLDGTLLPMDQEQFVKAYLSHMAAKMAPHGYDPKQLVETIWKGTAAMIKNDGSSRNENVFWNQFTNVFGQESLKDLPLFEEFYRKEFGLVREVCGHSPLAARVITRVQEKGLRAVLATNPIFPAIATENRMRWAGLSPEDFELYTTYENSRYCKPNPAYYRDILDRLGLSPEECVMVGNDVQEDMITQTMGMRVFLLTDCLIDREKTDLSRYPNGGFEQLLAFIDAL